MIFEVLVAVNMKITFFLNSRNLLRPSSEYVKVKASVSSGIAVSFPPDHTASHFTRQSCLLTKSPGPLV